jgi:hypothetical protein
MELSMADAPKPKQVTLVISEDATRALLDSTKARIQATPQMDEQQAFLEELQSKIARDGLASVVETVGTSTKFHSVVIAGN